MRRATSLALACLAGVVSACLGGCLYTAPELVEAGERFHHESVSSPRALASCIGRNATATGLLANVLDGAQSNTYQVAISISGGIGAFAFAETEPARGGKSTARLFITPINLDPRNNAVMFFQGC